MYKAVARDSETAFRKKGKRQMRQRWWKHLLICKMECGKGRKKWGGDCCSIKKKKKERYNPLWNVSFREKHCPLFFKKVSFGTHAVWE